MMADSKDEVDEVQNEEDKWNATKNVLLLQQIKCVGGQRTSKVP